MHLMCQAVSGPSIMATPPPVPESATMDPYGPNAGPMVDGDGEEPDDDDYETQRLEEKKRAKRNRMKFNRSLESALPHISLIACLILLTAAVLLHPGPNCPDVVLKKATDGKYGALDGNSMLILGHY